MHKIKFSKPFNDILNIKNDFFKQNNFYLRQAVYWNKFYANQPKRVNCKNCKKKLGKEIFKSHFVNYTICNICSHFNGLYEDTDKFNNFLYKNDKDEKFSRFYHKNYNLRLRKIYQPKLNFLKEVIKKPKEILDLGCGAGHFVKACELKSIKASGYDVSKSMVNLGNRMLKINKIYNFEINDIYKYVQDSTHEVISILGVLEHLKHPDLIFKNFKNSKAKYLYISVPLFSFSVFLEHAFQDVFPRVLGGVHNHLYTEKSLKYIIKKNKLKIIGEWWFGTDMMDLLRFIKVKSNPKNAKKFKNNLSHYFISIIDDLQKVLDQKKLCGDVHLVLKKS
jgi:SAM-dependent methyltransferase